MNYLELLKIENWDGKPFDAYATDKAELGLYKTRITGYDSGYWVDTDDVYWKYVYPINE